MTALSVLADPAARHAGKVDEVVASLPVSLTHAADRAGADVVAIAGDVNWPARAVGAIEEGARAVLIVRPVDADTTGLARTAREKSVVVVIDTPWAGNPVMTEARVRFRAAARSGGSLELRLVVPTNDVLQLALVDGLQLTRAVLGEVADVRPLTWTRHGLHAEGRVGDVLVDLAIVGSDATRPHASVRLLAVNQAVELQLPDCRSARPAQLMTVTGDGAASAPTLFESAHRAAWRRLLHHVNTGTPTEDLAHWQVDTATAARAAARR
jgi:hypothetical protein